MNDFVASFFKFQERKTTWQRETIGGITSFVTMAYIIFVNPQIMAAAGMDKGTVMLATCLAAAAGTLLMALYANAPFGLAPGMGINAFFAYTLCGAMGYTWEQGLGAVLLSGYYFCCGFCYRTAQQDHFGNTDAFEKSDRHRYRDVHFVHRFKKCVLA